jgi:hypothetical protein
MGVAKPEGPAENVIGTATRALTGASPFTALGGLLSKSANAVTKGVGTSMASQPALQAVSAAGAGAGGESAKQSGAHPLVQFGASLTAGLTPAGIKYGIQSAKANIPIPESDINKIIRDTGVSLSGMTQAGIGRLKAKVKQALQVGELDATMLKRMADFERTGTTPTRASITLDPVDATQQKNLAKTGANSTNPSMQQLARVENENNRQLIQQMNEVGADQGLDLLQGGRSAMQPIVAKQTGLLQTQKDLYSAAKASDGRAAPLDRGQFINRVDELLVGDNKTAFLPDSIKTMLNDISGGTQTFRGQTHDVPFDVNTIDQLKTTLSKAKGADGNANQALKLVRQALDETQLQGGASDDAIKAFDAARAHTFSMKTWEKSTPAIKAIVDGTDPDRFMDKFIIGKTASYDDVAKLATEIKADPTAFNVVKGQLASWLKSKALSGNADEVAKLSSSNLNSALKSVGDRKLKLFFSDDELNQLKSIQRVASYDQFQPAGSAVNNSNSATTLQGGLLNFIAGKSPTLSAIKTAVEYPMRVRGDVKGAGEALSPNLFRPPSRRGEYGLLAAPLSMGLLP